MLLLLPIILCGSALKIHRLCSIYYAQEQGIVDYYAFYNIMYFCMSNSLHVADNFYKTCFIRVLMKGIKVYQYALSYDDCSIKVY